MNLFRSSQQKQYLDRIENLYADKLGNSFMSDKKARRHLVRAVADFQENQYEACLEKLAKLQDRCAVPKDRQVILFFAGASNKGLGRLDQAIRCYEDVLRITPDYSAALSNLSVIYIDLGDYKRALPYAQKAVECDRNNPYAAHNLASILFNLYRRDEAKKHAMDALALFVQFKQAAALLAMIYATEHNESKEDYFTKMAVDLGQNEQYLTESKRYYKDRYEMHADIEHTLALWKKMTRKNALVMDCAVQADSVIGLDENGDFSSAKIVCSALPSNEMFPDHGTISITVQGKEAKVFYSEKEDEIPLTAARSVPVRFSIVEEWMPFANFAYDNTVRSVMENDIHILPAVFREEDFVRELSSHTDRCKMCGYPDFNQYDPRENSELQQYDVLLLQWSAKKTWSLLIASEKLAARDFSDILLIVS